MPLNLLTDAELRGNTPATLHDGEGLYLMRTETSASWILRYTIRRTGKRAKIGLGPYPVISLRRARELAAESRSLAAEGIDPRQRRRDDARQGVTVETAIKEYFESIKPSLKGDGVAGRWWSPVTTHIIPKIGSRGVVDLTTAELVKEFGPLWREKNSTAIKVLSILRNTLLHASAEDIRVDLTLIDKVKKRLGKPPRVVGDRHHKALAYHQAPALYKALPEGVVGQAFRFYMLTLPRVANVTGLPWAEIDLDARVWEIPGDRTKTSADFTMPLTARALDILRWSRRVLKHPTYVFPNPKGVKNPTLHSNSFLNWVKENGFDTTPHGLRATFATWSQEEEICSRDIADMCLQHQIKSEVERAYNRSELLQQRRAVLERWGAYIATDLDAEKLFESGMKKLVRDAENDLIGDGYTQPQSPEIPDRGDKSDWFEKG